jgi:hypothetical protein
MKKSNTIAAAILLASTAWILAAPPVKIVDGELENTMAIDVNGGITVGTEPVIAQIPFLVAVAAGDVEGYSAINKFGHNPAATAGDDIWAAGGSYAFYPTNAVAMEIVSTDTNDVAGGAGAQSVTVFGLDGNWDEISETVIMNGTTSVDLTNTYRRMNRAFVNTIGSSESNVGAIAIEEDGGGGNTGAYIAAGDGQTQQAIYTIPRGKSAMFIKGYVALKEDTFQGTSGDFKWKLRLNNGTTGAWQTKGQIGLINIGSSWWQYEYGIPIGMIPAKTDIRLEQSAATDPMDSVGGFDLLLIDD